ncbi:MAG: DUF3320 domain-containing protein [Acidobacteria bacterium]|nr:DUF3320 domain-containing protein [Acidobacteriota bacterium]
MTDSPQSVPETSTLGQDRVGAALRPAVEVLRRQLLDISKRNRLTNTPVGKRYARQLEIVDERSDEVFRILYVERKKMTFEANPDVAADSPEDEEGETAIFVPTGDGSASALSSHHVDRKLRTALGPEPLQKRLLTLYRGARSLEEEQGVSVLFLALGFLRWYEDGASEVERFAPLVLLPVDLERDNARGRFRLVYRDQDLDANLSLGAMLENDFALKLPDLPDGADWRPSSYFKRVRDAVSSQPRWRVDGDAMVLGFYSFAKFLMWRDLSPENDWGEESGPEENPIVSSLLAGGFEGTPDSHAPVATLDEQFPDPGDLGHILDADASQTRVIAAAREGLSMVVQGPPGTGKSQTIANIIAVAARDGKRVLFVAEKRAALDVVHARLEQCGLGPLCLELHSHKAMRRRVYDDLKATLELGAPHRVDDRLYEQVREQRDELNRLSALLHEVDEATGATPYGVIGRLALLDGRGVSRPDFVVDGADTWSKSEFERRRAIAGTLADLVAEHGSELDHVWRGARRRLGQVDRRALQASLGAALEAFRVARDALADARHQTGLPPAATFEGRREALRRFEAAAKAPALVGRLLAAAPVVERPAAVLALFEDLGRFQAERAALLEDCIESALDLDWTETRLDLAAHGGSAFRWFSGVWRRASKRLGAMLRPGWRGGHSERLELLDRLIRCRKSRLALERGDELGRAALDGAWRGEETDVSAVLPAMSWIAAEAETAGAGLAARQWFEGLPDGPPADAAGNLRQSFADWTAAFAQVSATVGLDPAVAFGVDVPTTAGTSEPEVAKAGVAAGARGGPAEPPVSDWVDSVDLEELEGRLVCWARNMDGYEGWLRLSSCARQAAELGLGALRERLADGRLEAAAVADVLRFVRAEAVWNRFLRETPEIEVIDGAGRTAAVERFRTLDAELQHLASQEAALRHYNGMPSGSAGQIGIVRGECNKKTRHMPLRRLLDVAGEAVAAIKPVFLMSPLSVAQFLRPGGLMFDLLLIDEASQVRPADAMGAVLRARQVIVVGDQKQLPPTSFFDRQVSGDEDDTDEDLDVAAISGMQIADMESILSLCEARAMAPLMLEWHYRSMHPSLIEVSNNEFYGDRLVCPPSPSRAGGDFGLSFVHVDGVYGRGRRRNNPREAEAVVDEVLRHVRERPGLSLGVVALSVAQRDTIEDRVEYMRSRLPELDAFCGDNRNEPFFVKNLENVQGDERDVIFISIGYGRDADGYMAQSFGPVSGAGGERRLNVLFTRAKRQCRVFSSIRYEDIRLDAAKHRGPRVLRRFLKYAQTGEMDVALQSGREMDSPFEHAVANALADHGYKVAAQVGSSGFRIDLAVRDPDHEGRFLLAVECDGARYHSSSWARERDRLRQAVLEQKGWTFHRVWSTDWFYNRDIELQKLLEAIERARTALGSGSRDGNGSGRDCTPESEPSPEILRDAPRTETTETSRVPYREASFRVSSGFELHEAPLRDVAECVAKIVEVEGPVHIEEVGRRLSRLWGYKRTGSRIQKRVAEAVTALARVDLIRVSGAGKARFLEPAKARKVEVRDRRAVESGTLRKIDMLPPVEVRAALVAAVERNIGINAVDCAREVARAFGFKATSADLRRLVAEEAERLVGESLLVRTGEELRLP